MILLAVCKLLLCEVLCYGRLIVRSSYFFLFKSPSTAWNRSTVSVARAFHGFCYLYINGFDEKFFAGTLIIRMLELPLGSYGKLC